jgi:hypothetical protein
MQIEVDKPLRLLECDEEQKKIVLEKMPALFTKTFEAGCTKNSLFWLLDQLQFLKSRLLE